MMTAAAQHLLTDILRRHWTIYAFTILLAPFLMLAGRDGLRIQTFYAVSMETALFLAVVPFTSLIVREVRQLPLSRRSFWNVQWMLSTVVPVAVTTAAKVFAVTTVASGVLAPEQVLLSSLYDFLYCGLIVGLCTMASFWGVMAVIVLSAPVLFSVRAMLPIDPGGIDVVTTLVFAVAAVVTVRGFLHSPPTIARPAPNAVQRGPSRPPRLALFANRLSGLPALVWREGRMEVLVQVAMFGVFAVVALLPEHLWPAGPGVGWFPLLFTPTPRTGPIVAVVFVMAGVAGDNRLASELRLLRTLPMSAARLAAMLTSFAILATISLWVLLFAGQVMTLGEIPPTVRVDLFLIVAGTWSLARAVRVVLPAHMIVKAWVGGLVALPAILSLQFVRTALVGGPAGLSLLGLAAILASFAVNYWGLRRSSRLYKRQSVWPPFANSQNPA